MASLKLRAKNKNVEDAIENIKTLKFYGDEITQVVKKFVHTYKRWSTMRGYVCKEVTALADKIDQDHKNANIAKLIGGSFGALSSVVFAAGFIAAPSTSEPSLIASVVEVSGSSVVTGAAAITTVGAAVVDEVLQFIHKDKALEHLHAEQEMTEYLAECLQEVNEASSEFEAALNMIVVIKGLPIGESLRTTEEMKTFLFGMKDWIHKYVPSIKPIFENIEDNWETIRGALILVKAATGLATVGITIAMGSVVLAATSCVLQIINLIVTSIDVHNGSKTEIAAKLREYVAKLEEDKITLDDFVNTYFSHLL